jgi:hypothetical protein
MIVGPEKATNAIWEPLKGGMIDAVAATSSTTAGDGNPVASNDPVHIPKGYWKYSSNTGTDLWDAANARFFIPARARHAATSLTVRCFNIKFNPDDIHKILPPLPPEDQRLFPPKPTRTEKAAEPQSPPEKPAEKANKGGRPRSDFWDDLWIEVCAHIHEEGVSAQQADIENMMLDWAAKKGHELSVSSVRPRARNLLNRLRNPRTKT